MERHDLEQLRRAVAMLPPGHSSGALSKDQAEALIGDLARLRQVLDLYVDAIRQIRSVLDGLD